MIDRVLDQLLHKRSYLARFLEDCSQLALSPADEAALSLVDRDELTATATAVRHDVMRRNHRGSGSLLDLYAATIGERDFEELVADFMESEHFDAYREVPFAGRGISLEEAFFRHCEARAIGDSETRARELVAAMVKALLLSPRPDFHVPNVLHACPRGVFGIADNTLYAALDEKLVVGPLTPFLVDLLLCDDPTETIAQRHGVAEAELAAAIVELENLGLWPLT